MATTEYKVHYEKEPGKPLCQGATVARGTNVKDDVTCAKCRRIFVSQDASLNHKGKPHKRIPF